MMEQPPPTPLTGEIRASLPETPAPGGDGGNSNVVDVDQSPASLQPILSSPVGENRAADQQATDSPVTAAHTNHNKGARPCPGYEEAGDIWGYSELSALQRDLEDYFASLVRPAEGGEISPPPPATGTADGGAIVPGTGSSAGPADGGGGGPVSEPSPSSSVVLTDTTSGGAIAGGGDGIPADAPPGVRKRARGHARNGRRRLQLGEAGAGIPANAYDSQVVREEGGLVDEVQAGGGMALAMEPPSQEEVDGTQASSSSSGNSDIRSQPEEPMLTTSAQEPTTANVVGGSSGATPLSFYICPKSNFEFKDISLVELTQLRIQTPLERRPVEIRCMDDVSCVFSGGGGHLLIDGPGSDEGVDRTAADSHPVTVSGITFRGGHGTSVRMNDPRGRVTFENCVWEDNVGAAAISIDGRHAAPAGETGTTIDPMVVAALEQHIAENGTGDAPGLRLRRRYLSGYDEEGETIEKEGGGLQRSLAVVGAVPRSIVSIEKCLFRRNKGNATIMVSSFSEELTLVEQDPGVLNHNDDLLNGNADGMMRDFGVRPLAHSIHLSIKETTFSFERVDTSIIENYGGRLQSSGCVFANNTAESIIRSEDSTVAISATEFTMNNVQGKEALIVLDPESLLEQNEGTCIRQNGDAVASVSVENNGLDSFAFRQADVPVATEDAVTAAARCEGIFFGGGCNSFQACEAYAPAVATATDEAESLESSKPAAEVVPPAWCFSKWDDLVVAVRNRPEDNSDFIICPTAKLIATSPVVIEDSNYVTIQCGKDESPSNDCEIHGGFSHFHIVGSSSGVQISRLKMLSSTGSSIMALGSVGATLNLRECEWWTNKGASAILIHSDESLNNATETLDVVSMLGSNSTAMSVGVIDCLFEENEMDFATIANIGGSLSVDKTMFANNAGDGGDIVVMDKGTCTIQESCFNSSASIKPGTIFIQKGSEMIENKNNFGSDDITAGGFEGGTCTTIFQESEGADCLGSASCTGICTEFPATTCTLDLSLKGKGKPSAAPKETVAPAHVQGKGGKSGPKVVPIVVATVVTAFAVFGLIGIIFKRKKSKKPSTTNIEDVEESPGRCGCCKRKKKDKSALEPINADDELFDDEDV
eukprot:CAMPEP_0172533466 /NCGR_PEP_ID=MMETSP1067-20121228/6161_1 /TAXON_ID=265564 ORGANISM="Thalassiosira punctigera, Strain Tpunct2005C2" /NCGR_SAMPLE_ID=MMETSP1067 /ASSEMBLY_ACC=CAM_ASM_000444 /LENGTH=1104 /DNA_ID=CAMNT_0013318113 /DNA_START=66 /DNA_END=3380 /DNA_ORIENTATION=+